TSSQFSLVQNNKQEHKNKKGETTTDKKEDKTKDSSTAVDLKSEEKKDSNENPQTLKEQTMVLQKVIATSEDDLNSDSLKGVNSSKFTVYDVTDLMNTIIKEKLKVSDSAPTDEAIDKAVDKFNEDGKEVVNTTTDAKEKEATKNSDKQAEGKASTQAPKADLDLSDSTKESKDKEKSSETSQSSKSKSSEEKVDKSSSDTNKNKEDKKSEEEEKLVAEIEQMRKDDTIRKEVASRAAKLDPKEMKTFAQVTTEHDKESNKD